MRDRCGFLTDLRGSETCRFCLLFGSVCELYGMETRAKGGSEQCVALVILFLGGIISSCLPSSSLALILSSSKPSSGLVLGCFLFFLLILSFSKGYLLLTRLFPLISPPGAALPSTSLLPVPLCNPSNPHSTQLLFFPHNSFPTPINPHLSPGGRPIFLAHPEGVCALPLALRELPRLGLLGGCQAAVPFWSLLG